MDINNSSFIDAMMTLTDQSADDRKFLETMLDGMNPHPNSPFRIRIEQIKATLTTFEEVVRQLAEQQMQIEEGLNRLMDKMEGEDRKENGASDETNPDL